MEEGTRLREKTASLVEEGGCTYFLRGQSVLSSGPDCLVQGLRAVTLQWEHTGQLALCATIVREGHAHASTPISASLVRLEHRWVTSAVK